MRFILNEDVIAYDPAKEKPKRNTKTATNSEQRRSSDPMEDFEAE
jgi:hypothetical protein